MKLSTLKSQAGVISDLYERLLLPDFVLQDSSLLSSSRRDFQTFSKRLTTEGPQFATKTLPKLGKAIEQALGEGTLVCPREFGKTRRGSAIPAFLQAILLRIFTEEGVLLEQPDTQCIKHALQVCYAFYKYESPYDDITLRESYAKFVENDIYLQPISNRNPVYQVAADLVSALFEGFDPANISPRHGPGAVANGETLDEKFEFKRLYNDLHQKYPYYRYFIVGGANELVDRIQWYKGLVREKYSVTKSTAVPKDSRGPRLISIEPLEKMWIQQGLGRSMMDHIESHWLSKGHINFTDQSINQELAQRASVSGEFATIDLKDASDRVSLDLVRKLFARTELYSSIMAARSSATTIPTILSRSEWLGKEPIFDGFDHPINLGICTPPKNGGVLWLKKYASMGSALCFPVEAVVFWSLAVGALRLRTQLNKPEQHVYVYGDDIICPSEYVDVVIEALESAGLKVNLAKTFSKGFYRESCGIMAYKGQLVTPTRFRKPFSGKRTDATQYLAYIAYANQLGLAGYALCADFLWKELTRIYGKIPYGTKTASYPCKVVATYSEALSNNIRCGFKWLYDASIQDVKFLFTTAKSRKVKTTLDGWQRLLRGVTTPFLDADPSVNVVPRTTRLKRGWVRVG